MKALNSAALWSTKTRSSEGSAHAEKTFSRLSVAPCDQWHGALVKHLTIIKDFVVPERFQILFWYGVHDVYFYAHDAISDEAHFWLNDYVNKQNCRIWSEANPQVYVETPLHSEKLTVCCALWAGGILLQKR
ncbi:hypothetical protein TNCV_4841021 [Trichonephila clavipes]|uniref:Uncharacterized protein n=1 Tax=Trichonephila clavipes TaxID=2585209 RepID=A0A8X6WL28_TRICX|nr:hypothetical protein TNCV_4841021 [Trichonephila clavipes]